MKTFKDAAGREWVLVINTENAKRVRDLTGFNVLKSETASLAEDPILLVDVLYALCKPQAEDRKISDTQFGQELVGDPIQVATDALLEEITNFFPSGRRTLMKRALTKIQETEQKAIPLIEAKMDREMEKLLNEIRGTSSTSKPESLESIPQS